MLGHGAHFNDADLTSKTTSDDHLPKQVKTMPGLRFSGLMSHTAAHLTLLHSSVCIRTLGDSEFSTQHGILHNGHTAHRDLHCQVPPLSWL